MPELVRPNARYRDSVLAAISEPDMFGGRSGTFRWDNHPQFTAADVRANFPAYIAERLREENSPPWKGAVTATLLWWVEGQEFLGWIHIRHVLTPALRDYGGHIGYAVRPSARRKGHATAMLRAALERAADLGIDPALLTCDVGNTPSRKVIESNGGKLAGQHYSELHFWVATR